MSTSEDKLFCAVEVYALLIFLICLYHWMCSSLWLRWRVKTKAGMMLVLECLWSWRCHAVDPSWIVTLSQKDRNSNDNVKGADLKSSYLLTYNMCMQLCVVYQALESEITAHEPLMETVTNMAHHMVAKKHPAVHEIESKLSSLMSDLQRLKELTAERKLKLTDAVESQTVCCCSTKFFTPQAVSITSSPIKDITAK